MSTFFHINVEHRTQKRKDTQGPGRPKIKEVAKMMGLGGYLEGQGDLVSILSTPRNHSITPAIPIIQPFTKSP